MFWRDTLASFLEWVQGIGAWGAVLFAAAYIPAAVLLVPAPPRYVGFEPSRRAYPPQSCSSRRARPHVNL